MVNDLRDPSRDMTLDRTSFQKSKILIQEIWNTFEQVYLNLLKQKKYK